MRGLAPDAATRRLIRMRLGAAERVGGRSHPARAARYPMGAQSRD
jgi:hypothetical protein